MIRSLLQQFPHRYPFIPCFARTDSVFIYETELPLVECGYDRPISFLPSPSVSSIDLSRLFPPSHMSNHLSTCSPPSFLLSSSSDLSFSPPLLFPFVESSTLQSGAATYIIRWIPSPGFSCTEGNRAEPNWARMVARTEDAAGAVSIFCSILASASGRFHRGGRCRVYVDL